MLAYIHRSDCTRRLYREAVPKSFVWKATNWCRFFLLPRHQVPRRPTHATPRASVSGAQLVPASLPALVPLKPVSRRPLQPGSCTSFLALTPSSAFSLLGIALSQALSKAKDDSRRAPRRSSAPPPFERVVACSARASRRRRLTTSNGPARPRALWRSRARLTSLPGAVSCARTGSLCRPRADNLSAAADRHSLPTAS
jgi:hypothetical protein